MNRACSLLIAALCIALASGCTTSNPADLATAAGIAPATAAPAAAPSETALPAPTIVPTATPRPLVPEFQHIVTIVLENKEFGTVIGSPKMPFFNQMARDYTLLTQLYAVTHPSLPNYLAMIGGDTFGITFDCYTCITDGTTLPDLIEASGRTWKTYQEDMPSPCYDKPEYGGSYAIKHNPFMYFKPIRLDAERCQRSVVPYTQLPLDIASGRMPNYVFITPNMCNDAHDCEINVADNWLSIQVPLLQAAMELEGKPYLIILTWDEGQGSHSCCGLPQEAGGRIATILISPQVKNGFEDSTPYTLYSILKTIEESWHLQYLGHSADAENALITAPWK